MAGRTVIHTELAPQAIGPYSQAVRAGNLLFCSGQIAIDPATGELDGPGDVTVQTQRVLTNLGAVLEAASAGFAHVVKTTIYLKNMDDFPVVNEIYARCFSDAPPARATVEVSRLPKDVCVEIDAIAVLDP
jgi:2-iminobutanoate/2-iminopropanoate deaminase